MKIVAKGQLHIDIIIGVLKPFGGWIEDFLGH